jgi:hypothetical protein
MGDIYLFSIQQNALSNASFKTAGTFGAAAAAASGVQIRRGRLLDILIGQNGTPNGTDCGVLYDVSRCTAYGTSTAVTANPGDGADAAFMGLAGQNHSAEPTYAAAGSGLSMLQIALNQRGAIRWQARDDNQALVWPATANNGFGLRGQVTTASAYTGAGGGSVTVQE